MNVKHFVNNSAEWEADRCMLKTRRCPHCLSRGTLTCHGRLYGYCLQGTHRVLRGFRLLCSNRYRHSGCGRTVSVWFSWVLHRSVVSALEVWQFITGLLDGQKPYTIARQVALGSSSATAYRLCARLAQAQFSLRASLQRLQAMSAAHRNLRWAWLQPYDQLRQLHDTDAIQWWQYQFQRSLMKHRTSFA